jgi:hypothetical protein
MAENAARAEWLTVAGDPDIWRSIGLTVSADGLVPLFGTSLRIVAPTDADADADAGTDTDTDTDGQRGLVGWAFSGIPDVGDVAGFPTEVVDVSSPVFASHELGASQLDHLVIFTGSMDDVSEAIEARTGCERKRVRDLGEMQQGFHRIGRGGLIVEIVQHADRDRSTEMWGLVLIVDDLDAACALLGEDRISAPKEAVQPGRRIATIRPEVGLGTAVALMSA